MRQGKKKRQKQYKQQIKFYKFGLAPTTGLGTKEVLYAIIMLDEISYHHFCKVTL